jgi:hypothetical protein
MEMAIETRLLPVDVFVVPISSRSRVVRTACLAVRTRSQIHMHGKYMDFSKTFSTQLPKLCSGDGSDLSDSESLLRPAQIH